jgi:50S ribosomal protein L16 3-hydroxylase
VTRVLGGMSTKEFLRTHWQKKPLLVRAAFPKFVDPIDPDELAGLACEEGVESRIVHKKNWRVTWGPHPEERFAKLPKKDWTLLVQEVNRHVADAALLLEPFSFLPNVRVDDVMISFAAPGGSVGPHLDSYDVFLVQGQGQRRWLYGTRKTRDARFRPGLELRILESFEPDADEVLGPGDMLYLPPGFAHHGIGVTPCLTYSIGFRAPNAGEMWTSLARIAASKPEGARLLEDPALEPAKNPGAIPPAMLARVREMVRSLDTTDESIDRWFASFATRLTPDHVVAAPRRPPDAKTILTRLRRGDPVARSEEGRWAYLRDGRLLYFAGAEHVVDRSAAPLARCLCATRRFAGQDLARLADPPAARTLIASLFAAGALRFERPEPRASER